jgi:hypothetical protein
MEVEEQEKPREVVVEPQLKFRDRKDTTITGVELSRDHKGRLNLFRLAAAVWMGIQCKVLEVYHDTDCVRVQLDCEKIIPTVGESVALPTAPRQRKRKPAVVVDDAPTVEPLAPEPPAPVAETPKPAKPRKPRAAKTKAVAAKKPAKKKTDKSAA